MIYVGIDVQFSNYGDGFQYLISAFEPFDDEEMIDTYIIAQTLMMQKSYRFVTFEDLDQTFPELQYFFKSGLHQKSVYSLQKEAPTA